VIVFHLGREMRNQIAGVKQQLLQNPLIESVATASNPIGNNNIGGSSYGLEADGKNPARENKANRFQADEDFLPALQIKLMAGRNFSESMLTDKDHSVLVNETLAKDAGWHDAVGKRIQLGVDSNKNPLMYNVVGITRDFNIYSLQHKIEPLILQLPPAANDKDNMYVRISRTNLKAALAYVNTTYKKFDAVNPFEYSFLDQNFSKQYEAEQMQGNLLMIFTILAISIACLGLFGLVTFTAEQRRKEIGIRKVLGGSVSSIVLLLASDLLKLVLVAMVIATPLAWLASNQWLQNFYYKAPVAWWIFLLSGALTLVIAFITIGFKAIRAALSNPVKSLRTE